MRRTAVGLSLALVAGMGLTTAGLSQATAVDRQGVSKGKHHRPAHRPVEATASGSDALPNPLADKQAALRQQAISDVLSGTATAQRRNGSTVVRVGTKAKADGTRESQYVELARERTDRVFTLLVQFGDQRYPGFPDVDTNPAYPGPSRFDGPLFNQIPKPPADDNSTNWLPNYSKGHYRKLFFGSGEGVESLKTYYEKQSSGRYSVSGEVNGVVNVPYNEARYGRSIDATFFGVPCTVSQIVCANTWALIDDGMNQWVADQEAAGQTLDQIKAYLATFDRADRYDYDGDGDFNEPDGYLDHLQIVHAGGDQSDGDPYQGEDAIWSHRWYTHLNQVGATGPSFNPLGGSPLGDTGYWAGDYTVQPENAGLGVVTHEYGHDLGLPDEYDTAGGDDPAGWWTLMDQSRVSAPGDQGIGTRAADLGAWDKLQLGWLDYAKVAPGIDRTIKIGPHEYNSHRPQALVMKLPDKPVDTTLPTPPEGTHQWWSGQGDDYAASMSREDLAIPAAGGTLSLQAAYNIEEDYDAAYLEVEAPAGSGTWTALPTDALDPDSGTGADVAIDGSSGYVSGSWDLSAYAGQTIGFRVRYLTDGAVQGDDPSLGWSGILVDDVEVTSGSTTVFADGAENPPGGWTLDGFTSVGTTLTNDYAQYYIASYRTYASYDRYLKTGPYQSAFAPGQPSKLVDHFPMQDGLLVNYWDTQYTDNNTSQHPGHGLILPIDAHRQIEYRPDGAPWRTRVQKYDATFGTQATDPFTIRFLGQPDDFASKPPVRTFDDTNPLKYYQANANAGVPAAGVITAGIGVRMKVLEQNDTTMVVRIF